MKLDLYLALYGWGVAAMAIGVLLLVGFLATSFLDRTQDIVFGTTLILVAIGLYYGHYRISKGK